MVDLPSAGPPFLVELEGASNVRDLGGYLGIGDRLVRRHGVYRSAALATLMPRDLETLGALDIHTICDFHGVEERTRANPADRARAGRAADRAFGRCRAQGDGFPSDFNRVANRSLGMRLVAAMARSADAIVVDCAAPFRRVSVRVALPPDSPEIG